MQYLQQFIAWIKRIAWVARAIKQYRELTGSSHDSRTDVYEAPIEAPADPAPGPLVSDLHPIETGDEVKRPGMNQICMTLGCPNVKPCAAHPPVESPRSAETAERDKFYKTATWLKLRSWWLGLEPDENAGWRCGPLCWACKDKGRVAIATDVDHIKPVSAGGSDTEPDNLQSLCHSHHSAKSRREQLARKEEGI